MSAQPIGFILNGKPVTVAADPATRLADALREGLGFTGRGEGIVAMATATVRLPWSAP